MGEWSKGDRGLRPAGSLSCCMALGKSLFFFDSIQPTLREDALGGRRGAQFRAASRLRRHPRLGVSAGSYGAVSSGGAKIKASSSSWVQQRLKGAGEHCVPYGEPFPVLVTVQKLYNYDPKEKVLEF